ncbi:MAG TPA: DUF5808 domain-containing protein [Streptosporangiaceae bacterium]|nr:DUF5808 domain-containing protein [Streptosporangiaceae bacterium]
MTHQGRQPPEPQGHFGGMPYDWRKPTEERAAARLWNPGDRRLFTPKSFGWGYTVNFYWLAHPLRYLRNLSSS